MSIIDLKNNEDVSIIIQKNLPDKNYEIFWYGFKNSIINLINNLLSNSESLIFIELENNVIENLNTILNEVNSKSDLLNQYQKKEEYDNIKFEIEKYIKWISRYLFIPYANFYHFNIYFTNLKRWTKWVINKDCDNLMDSPKIEKKNKKQDKIDFAWLKDEFNNKDDFFIIFFNLLKYCYDYEYNKNEELEKKIINRLIFNLKKYNQENFYTNKAILDNSLNFILLNKFLKPFILIEFSKYYNMNEKLKSLGYIKKDIPDNWTVEKIFKKGLLS
jgi:hypothetical protein